MSQDHIELFFGCIRSQGGCNNNPTARQFKAAYKKMLVHSEITTSNTGNCIPLEAIDILYISSNPVVAINSTSGQSRIREMDDENTAILEYYVPMVVNCSEFSSRVITYIAGFVIKHLMRKIQCEECINALVGDNSGPEYNLINIKNRGKLTYPSKDVVNICKKAEFAIRSALHENGGKLSKKHSSLYLSNRTLQSLLGDPLLFCTLEQHCIGQTVIENHAAHLMRAIASKYVQIRLFSLGSALTKDRILGERHTATKLILFKGL